MTPFFQLSEASPQRKGDVLRDAVVLRNKNETSSPPSSIIFECSVGDFRLIPGSPFAYWSGRGIREAFANNPRFDADRIAARGAYTTDDFKYYRLSWEVKPTKIANSRQETFLDKPYVPLAKGGAYSRYYSDVHLLIRWARDGAEPKVFLSNYRERKGWGADWSACLNGYSHYFRAGLTWSRRTQAGLGVRILPAGCIFSDKGPAVFIENDNIVELLSTLSVMNSRSFRYLVNLQMAFGSFEVGVIQRTPMPALSFEQKRQLAMFATSIWKINRQADAETETSHAFLLPQVIAAKLGLGGSGQGGESTGEIEATAERLVVDAYQFSEVDQLDIAKWVASSTEEMEGSDPEDEPDGEAAPSTSSNLNCLLSWTVGVAFGRFDIRLATGERSTPPEPAPFDPLPAMSPAMLPAGDPPFRPTSGILVDDPGHADDLAATVAAVYERVGESPPAGLRRALARDFFPAHIRMYSRSRRKAPIYWQLATPSASYSVWLYIHAFGNDTLFRVQNDYVAPKLAHELRELEGLLAEAGPSPTTAQSRAIEAQSTFVEELSALLDEVKHLARVWDPDLDDGVILNFAPLWRLVPQNRAWQKELRASWASLAAGDYDWAHLSMRLWPERVVPKCAKDRSLAIAHDLEDIFWFEDAAGKWQARPNPTRPIDGLVDERTSPAVKAALQSLLDAPDPVAASGRGRRKKS